MYNEGVAFEWDDDKAALNFAKHGVAFSEAEAVFEDDLAITIADYESDPFESRYVTLGIGAKANLLVVVYSYRGPNIRIISARKANKAESSQYGGQV